MNYIKAKFHHSQRSYTFRTEDDVKAGDTVINNKGQKLTVSEEPVDLEWVKTYGEDGLTTVKLLESVNNDASEK
jgi:hypothetical protein